MVFGCFLLTGNIKQAWFWAVLFPSVLFVLLIAFYEGLEALYNTLGQGLKLTAYWGSSNSKDIYFCS